VLTAGPPAERGPVWSQRDQTHHPDIAGTIDSDAPCRRTDFFPRAAAVFYLRAVPFDKITLVGVGLLGGSLALAIRERGLARVVAGYVRRPGSVTECAEAGLKDFATLDLAAAVQGADLVVLCTPLAQMHALAGQFLPSLKRGAIVTDVGSVKGSVVQGLEEMIAQAGGEFLGAHPMAGGERMGVGAAHANLFGGAVCILTPTARTSAGCLAAVEGFWRVLGTRLLKMSPDLHDELVARCSHLPHVVAAEIASQVLDPAHPAEQPALCANGFRDTTRIASGSPEMWRDIAMANRVNLSRVLGEFIEDLEKVREAVEHGDARAVEQFFQTAKQRRDAWRAHASSPSPE
jgi:prephenate dehydrogenase